MKISIKEMIVFSMFGAIMYATKFMLEFLPNVHLLGVFTMALTLVYRKKALYPIYVYVFLNGVFAGFAPWWIPYLYIWTILWGVTMLLPKSINPKAKPLIYMIVCSLHGFLFGVLYAPFQAIIYGMNFNAIIAWIIAGLPWDAVHGISNFFCAILIIPLVNTIKKAEKIY